MDILGKVGQYIKGQIPDVKSVVSRGLSSIYSSLGSESTVLSKRIDAGESLQQLIVGLNAYFPDALLETSAITLDNLGPYQTKIEEDDVDAFRSVIEQSAKLLGDNSDENALTITDSTGTRFSLISCDKQFVENGVHYKSVITSRYDVQGIRDAIIYVDDQGNYYMNSIIRTIDHVYGTYVNPVDIASLCMNMSIRFGREFKTVKDSLSLVAESLGCQLTYDTILGMASELCDFIEYQHSGTVLSAITGIYNYILIRYPIDRIQNKISSLWDVFLDYLSNLELMRLIRDNCKDVFNGVMNANSIIQSFANTTGDCYNYGSKLFNAFNEGGIYGAASFIISSLKQGSQLSETADGLVYTDPNTYTPKSWISGMASGIITLASTIISVISTVVSPVLAAAVYITGSTISSFVQLTQAGIDSITKPTIVDNEHTPYDISPYAPLKGECSLYDMHDDIQNYFETNRSSIIISVVGGYLFMGYKPDSNDTLRYEFHPNLHNNINVVHQLNAELNMLNLDGYNNISGDFWSSFNSKAYDINRISEIIINNNSVSSFVNSDKGIVDDDALFPLIMISNTLLFMLYYFDVFNKDNESQPDEGNTPTQLKFTYNVSSSVASIGDYTSHVAAFYFDPEDSVIANTNSAPFFFVPFALSLVELYFDYGSAMNNNPLSLNNDRYQVLADLFSSMNIAVLDQPCLFLDMGDHYRYEIDYSDSLNTMERGWIDYFQTIPSGMQFAVLTPKYTRSSVITGFMIMGVITIAVTALTIVASVKFSKWKRKVRARNLANAEAAWSHLTENPSDSAAQQAYVKAVKKNNLFATFFGGDKLSTTGYWLGGGDASGDTTFSKLASLNNEDLTSKTGVSQSFEALFMIICGKPFEP